MKQVGTVTVVNSARVYPLDAACGEPAQTAIVETDVAFPIYELDGMTYIWMMTGKLNVGRLRGAGDGLIFLYNEDIPSDLEVTFPSRAWGREQLGEFLGDIMCKPGPDQRLSFNWTEAPFAVTV